MVNHLTFGVNTFNKDAFSPNVGQDWKSKVCIPNAVDCNVNMGDRLAFTEFSTWGGAADNGTEQPRFSIKDDVTLTGARTPSSPASPSTASRRTASVSRISAAGPASASRKRRFRVRRRWPRRRQLVRVVPARRGRYRPDRNRSAISSRSIRYYAFYAQDDWRINDKLVLNYGARYEFTQPPVAGGDQYSDFSPTKPNPAVNNYPGALVFAGDGPGREGTQEPDPRLLRRAGAARSVSRTAPNDKTTVRGGVGRSFGRVTVVQGSSHFAGFIGQYVFASPDSGDYARVQPRSGSAGVSAAAADRSGVLEQQRRRLVQRSGRQPSGGVRQLDGVDAARGAEGSDGGGRLQRLVRVAPAGGPAESESGADVGRERSDCQVRRHADASPAELANHVGGGGRGRISSLPIRTSPIRPCRRRGAWPRRCGPIRNTRP